MFIVCLILALKHARSLEPGPGGILIEESWSGETGTSQSSAGWRQKGEFAIGEEARWRFKLNREGGRYRQQWNQSENKKETKEKYVSTWEITDYIHTWTDLGSGVLIQDIQPEL